MNLELNPPGLAAGPRPGRHASRGAFRDLMRRMSLTLGDAAPERVELLMDGSLSATLRSTQGGQLLSLQIRCGSLRSLPAGSRDAFATALARLCCVTSVHNDLGLALDAEDNLQVHGQRPLDGLEPADCLQWIDDALDTARQIRALVTLRTSEPPLPPQGPHDAPR